jgi:hypothetical protein
MLFPDLPDALATPMLEKHCTPNEIAFLRIRLGRKGVRSLLPTKADFKRLERGGWIADDKAPTDKAKYAVEDYEKRHGIYAPPLG